MVSMVQKILLDLAKELALKKQKESLITWDISPHLSLGIDLVDEKFFYITKPGKTKIKDEVTLDDILIVASAIKLYLKNGADKYNMELDLYYQSGVRYYANLVIFYVESCDGPKTDRFVIVGKHIAFKNRSGFNVYQHVPDGPGVWYQAGGKQLDIDKIKKVEQINRRRDRRAFDLLRETVKML